MACHSFGRTMHGATLAIGRITILVTPSAIHWATTVGIAAARKLARDDHSSGGKSSSRSGNFFLHGNVRGGSVHVHRHKNVAISRFAGIFVFAIYVVVDQILLILLVEIFDRLFYRGDIEQLFRCRW